MRRFATTGVGSSLAGRAVEQLAEEVEVAEVASGLLDHVEVHEPQGERWAALRVHPRLVELTPGGGRSGSLAGGDVAGHEVLDRHRHRGGPLVADLGGD